MKKLLKKVLTTATLGIMVLSFTACSNPNNTGAANNNTSTATIDKDEWIIGLDDTFAPLGFRDANGELTGFDVELAKAMGEKLGKKLILQPIDWSMKEAELNSGNIDLIWNGYTINDERKEKVDFTVPYLDNKQIIVVLADSPIQTKADLAGKAVGAQSESSAVTAMEKEADLYASFKDGKAVTFEDNNQALMDLDAGRIEAVVADEVVVRYYINLKGAGNYRILDEDFGAEEYGVGIRKGDTKTVEAFNQAYEELKADGTLAEIATKWFGSNIAK
nr:amino acid ABC transporter substrate-binding protein [uncultured Niameybacter sp.]